MTDEMPPDAADAFESHDAYEPAEEGATLTTTAFEGTVTADEADDDWANTYILTVRAPTLAAATAGDVPEVVRTDWFETLERRLERAPTATRASVDLTDFAVERDGDDVQIEFRFEWGSPGKAAEIAKTFAEYVEGTCVEGIVPGYEYEPPVSNLLASASQSGESGTPL